MPAQFVRRRDAARRFKVSKSTLDRWAKDRLIGRSQIGRSVWLNSADITALIARNEQPKTDKPITERRPDTAAAHAFFAGGRP